MLTKLDFLKKEADALGVKYNPNIGEEKLSDKIQEHKAAVEEAKNDPAKIAEVKKTRAEKRKEEKQKQLKMVRIQLAPMNPHMKGLKGQIYSVSNGLVGTVKKYIPFNSPHGWHVPKILVDELESKQYVAFYKWTDSKNVEHTRHRLTKAYGITRLPDLTPEEYAKIQRQLTATEDDDF